jgi:nucleoside-diphosphate-sugar epimerase
MKILITGASGFVGGALWQASRQAGHEVTGLGRRVIDDKDYVPCDLTKGLALDACPDVVVHAAARSSPWGSRKEFVAQNVIATRNVVDFCETHGRPLLIHISTSAVMYANEHQFDLDELTALPPKPINLYAATKRESESVIRSYSGPWCIVRPRAVFGPGDTVVFPRILRAARAGRLPLIESPQPVMGDLIYIDTLVDYLLRIMKSRTTGLYLLTNNQPVPVLDFLCSVFEKLGLPTPRRRVPVRRAMLAAAVVEQFYTLLPFLGEPPLTRFGVSVFAYSKTFNVGVRPT